MQLTIRRDDLLDALGAVIGAVPTRSTIPILANVLLRAGPDSLAAEAPALKSEKAP